jgi:hypothetical protein
MTNNAVTIAAFPKEVIKWIWERKKEPFSMS